MHWKVAPDALYGSATFMTTALMTAQTDEGLELVLVHLQSVRVLLLLVCSPQCSCLHAYIFHTNMDI